MLVQAGLCWLVSFQLSGFQLVTQKHLTFKFIHSPKGFIRNTCSISH